MIIVARFGCVVLAACCLGGCEAGFSRGDAASASVDTLPSGLIQVTNHGPSGWTDTNGWKIIKVSERVYEVDTPGVMERPNFPAAFSDGGMVVVNQKPVYLARYSPNLEPLGTFSRDGAGPGEFHGPESFVARDSIYVIDNARSVLAAFDREGKLAHEKIIPCCINDIGAVDSRGSVALDASSGNSAIALRWWSLDAGRYIDSVVLPLGPERVVVESCRMVLPFQSQRKVATGANGLTWWGVNDTDRFILTQHGTDTLLVTSNDRPRVPVTDADLAPIFDNSTMKQMCGPDLANRRGEVAKVKPAFSELIVDDRGALWVRRAGIPNSYFDVYAPDGRWLGEVPSPFTKGENWWWRGEQISSVETRDNGAFVLRLYRIDRSKGG